VRITDTVVIGAGQAGLAASRCLTDRGRDHVVLERGRIGQRWRSDTWDSLHLLTPNWMNTLPGEAYRGPDPSGFSSAATFRGHLTQYAESFGAPIEEHSAVRLLRKRDHRFEVGTGRATWLAANVIIATGWCDRPAVPAAARALPADVHQVVPGEYRNPGSLPDGGVLVVGASATGAQLADELRAAGRDVTIAVGRHTRMPRNYRGMDIYWWLGRLGLLDATIDEMPDRLLARREPSAQLVGGPDHRRLDLATLQAGGVRLAGRVLAIDGHRVRLATDLSVTVAAGIRIVVWATGYRRSYPWLRLPALDRFGEIRQRRGRTPVPGLYVLGQRFQHYRSSNFIGGVSRDAAFVADHLAGRHRAACACARTSR
jgi:putative flavoprotein involved in K+ transport